MSAKNETSENLETQDTVEIDEASAADTLHPGAGSGGTESKAQMLDTFVSLLAQLGKEDLSNLFNQSVAQIGKEAENIPSNAAAKNAATIATKGTVKEDLDEMFSGDELSEELKEKASVVFEAAVNTRLTLESARLEEEFEARKVELEEEFETNLSEAVEAITEEMSDKLDKYLDYVVEQWLEENKISIEASLRADIAENFIEGLKNLFSEHYITVPDEKMDLVAEMKTELDEVKERLNEALDKNIELTSVIAEANKESVINTVVEGLTVTHAEKLKTLAEGIEYTDDETFAKKLEILKESLTKKKPAATGLITEEIDGNDGELEEKKIPSGNMGRYVTQISKHIK